MTDRACCVCGEPIREGESWTCHGNPWIARDTGCLDDEAWHSAHEGRDDHNDCMRLLAEPTNNTRQTTGDTTP